MDYDIVGNIKFEKEKNYWLNKLSGELVKSYFPYDYSSVNDGYKNFKDKSINFRLPDDLFLELSRLSRSSDVNLHIVLMAIVNILLNKYTDNCDILTGIPIYKQEFDGDFINTVLAIRNSLTYGMTFKELILRAREIVFEAVENQNYPIDKLIYELGQPVSGPGFQLFDVIIMLENIHDRKFIEEIKCNIIFNFIKTDLFIECQLYYNSMLYKTSTIEKLINHYINILKEVLANVNIKLADINMLSDEERDEILNSFNNTNIEYSQDKTIVQLFEEQAQKAPENIAVVFKNRRMTYGSLNEKANRLAYILMEKGVNRGDVVGIIAKRSFEMCIAVLGILKSGCAYLPIEPAYPDDRKQYIIKDSNAKILIIQENLNGICGIDKQDIDIIYIDDADCEGSLCPNTGLISNQKDPAYIIYTSGSTGNPKGVLIEHMGILNTIMWRKNEYGLNEKDSVIQLFSYAFDGFLTSFFTPLVSGSRIILLDEDEAKDPIAIKNNIVSNSVSHFICIPSLYQILLECMSPGDTKSLRIVTLAGDKVTANILSKSIDKNPGIEITNEYGPTENSVASTFARDLGLFKDISIGKPIVNTKVYILDDNLKLKPVGITGEMYLSGHGLSRGYVNNPQLTSERFIQNPYIEGSIMFKTGDIGRWLPDGNIEFIGRKDNQVKIRGYRIELDEIEKCLSSHMSINETVICTFDDNSGNKNICAYYTSNIELTAAELIGFLSDKLPDFMIPGYFIRLDRMPYNINGKLDKKALPDPKNMIYNKQDFIMPRNPTEEKIAALWQEILGLDKVGVYSNFFDLGGQSLKAALLVTRIYKEFHKDIPLTQIFKTPTIDGIASYILNCNENIYSYIKPAGKKDYYVVSSAQKRMYILYQIADLKTSYNAPSIVKIEGKTDKGHFEKIIKKIIERHEILRTLFKIIDNEPVQIVSENVDFNLEYFEVERFDVDNFLDNFVRPFDLHNAPLFRAGLARISDDVHILIIDMHHIISDGISINIFIKEFIDLYNNKTLPELRIQYKDFSEWQNNMIKSGKFRKQEEYWLEVLKGEIPILNMPTDYPRPQVQSFEGDTVYFNAGKELKEKLHTLAADMESTPYMVLLAGFNILLSKYTGQDDIVVGTVTAGRPHSDIENVIGMFVNTLAIRNRPLDTKTFKEFLMDVKVTVLNAFENQDYQYEELIDRLIIPRDISRNPLFNMMFVMQNFDILEISLKDLNIRPYRFKNKITKFDITLSISEGKEAFFFSMEYCTKLFTKDTIERFSRHYINILEQLAANPDIKLSDIEVLSREERNQMLIDFNNIMCGYPEDKAIHSLFEEQVERTPDNTALVLDNRHMTYRELNRKANALAGLLRRKGAGRDGIVGLIADRSMEMITGILGILKAGAAYLPIDPLYPKERKLYMLKDSGAEILLAMGDMAEDMEFGGEVIRLDDEGLYEGKPGNPATVNRPEDLAYVIYTSGTTGKPKGVMIEHRNVVRLLFSDKMQFDFNDRDVWTMFHSYCFDFSVWEMYGALLYGGKLVIVPEMTAKDPREYLKLLKRESVTVLNQTPTAFYRLAGEEVENSDRELVLRYVIFGGEALKPHMLKDWRKRYPAVKLVNMYGITETTVHVTYKEITEEEIDASRSVIGRPIPTLTTYIMDRNMKLVPVGVVGELCVGGEGLGRGYLNRPELTAEKFIENPYRPGERLYRSGDLVRLLPDGEMEYLGRIDQQVKIRGHRVELREIENRLLSYEDIKETVAVAREDEEGDKYICSYYISGKEFSVKELREYLSKELPDYMIPAYFIRLEKIPLTSNGKIDKKALPEYTGHIITGVEYIAPVNEVEKSLVEIWSSILNINEAKIGINDSFFDLGGNSLLIVQMRMLLDKEYPGKVTAANLFTYPTIRELACFITTGPEQTAGRIRPDFTVFPQEYFSDRDTVDDGAAHNYRISGDIRKKLEMVSKSADASIYDILLALYMYLIYEITGLQEITIHTMMDEKDTVSPFSLSFSSIDDIDALISHVALLRHENRHTNYSIEKIYGFSTAGEKMSVSILFYTEHLLSPNINISRIYDICLGVAIIEDYMEIIFEYNFTCLKGDMMKKFISGFIKLVEMFANRSILIC